MGLYIIYDCRAMCDVCRSYLLGEYRKSCIRNDRETTVGAEGSNEQNPTFDLPCRDVFAKGQKAIEVVGPVEAVEVEAAKVHEGYWD